MNFHHPIEFADQHAVHAMHEATIFVAGFGMLLAPRFSGLACYTAHDCFKFVGCSIQQSLVTYFGFVPAACEIAKIYNVCRTTFG